MVTTALALEVSAEPADTVTGPGSASPKQQQPQSTCKRHTGPRPRSWRAFFCFGPFRIAATSSVSTLVLAGIIALALYLVRLSNVHPAPPMPPVTCAPSDCIDVDSLNAPWASLLAQHTQAGMVGSTSVVQVDYASLLPGSSGHALLQAYTDALAAVDLPRVNDTGRKALFINAYNVLAIKKVVDYAAAHGGTLVSSIRDIGDLVLDPVWTQPAGVVGGLTFSLDNIEHQYLRPHFQDTRIHAAVNCASVSCPNLRTSPFTAASLDAEMDEMVGGWLGDSKGCRVNTATAVVQLSQIFNWYGSDFTPDVPQWLAAHHPNSTTAAYLAANAGSLRINWLPYNWQLNKY